MIPVSQAFLSKMKDPQRVEHVRGTIGSKSFNDSNVLAMTYSNQCSDSKDVTFGSARIGELDARFYGINIARGSWRGQTISLEYGLELDDEHTTEWVQIGVFTIAKADWTDTGIAIVAYDCLADLDIQAQITNTVGTVFGMLTFISLETGVSLGLNQQECEALPNGDETFTLATPNDISTYRDFVSWIASAVGGFATANSDGELVIRSFADSAKVDELSARNRIVGSAFSDYKNNYAGIAITDNENGVQLYSVESAVSGPYISIGNNPLLQAELSQTKDRQRQAIAEVAHSINYTPFNISLLNCPIYELGDLIECSGGIAGSEPVTCCVMGIDWTFKNTIQLQGFGADPNLSSGKTRTDKALNSVRKQANDSGLTYYTFANTTELEINSLEETTIIDIEFAVTAVTTVMMLHEIKMLNKLLDATQTVTLRFYHNDELINYEPEDTYSEDEAYHFFPSFYTLVNVMAGVPQRWRVTAQTSSGTAEIDVGDVKATIFGQKMVATDAFKGKIPVDDATFVPVKRGRRVGALTDNFYPRDNPVISGLSPVTNSRTTVDGSERTIVGGDIRTIIEEE